MVIQEPSYGLENFTYPNEREKPWGTGHAVLCCENYINNTFKDCNFTKSDLRQSIINNCVPKYFVSSQRSRWIPRFIKKNVEKKFVRGNLILGEKNFLSYSFFSLKF